MTFKIAGVPVTRPAYVPKKGDIILYNSFSDTIEVDVVGNPNAFKGKDYTLVGLSLERIEADRKARNEKLIIALKEQFYDLYHQIGKVEVWREGGSDVFCDLVEEYINKQIDMVFASVDQKKEETAAEKMYRRLNEEKK